MGECEFHCPGQYAWDKKTRTSKVGAISKAQKQQKDFKESVKVFNFLSIPWKIIKQNERGALLVKKIVFEKKSHNAEKNWKEGPFGDFSTSVLSKNAKKLKVRPFGEKFLISERKVSNSQKYSEGVHFEFLRGCKNTALQAFASVFSIC